MKSYIGTTRDRFNCTFTLSPLAQTECLLDLRTKGDSGEVPGDSVPPKAPTEVVVPFPEWRVTSVTPYRRVKRDRIQLDPTKPVRKARRSPLLLVTIEEHGTGRTITFGEVVKFSMNSGGSAPHYTTPPQVIVNPPTTVPRPSKAEPTADAGATDPQP